MVASTGSLTASEPPPQSTLVDSPAADASTIRYLVSGERVLALMDVVWKLCLGLIVLVVLAWAFGALPIAVKLF